MATCETPGGIYGRIPTGKNSPVGIHSQHLISSPPLQTKFIELLDMLGAQRPEALGATLVHDPKTQRFVLRPMGRHITVALG